MSSWEETRRGEERLITINVKMSVEKKKKKKETGENVNHAHGLLEGTIKLVDQIHGERREWRESV